MATVTHVIRSHYDPADREKLECETGQLTVDDPWETESSFSAQRRIRAPPTFVPATVTYDEWGAPSHASPSPTGTSEKPPDQHRTAIAEWYKSLRLTAPSSSSLRVDATARPSSAPTSTSPDAKPARLPQPPPQKERVTKNDWFIRNTLRSEPSTKPSSPAPSLADLLARDPPPLPSSGRYVPPVWLHIGPSNIGFGMLERSGWKEGEGLGARVARRVVSRDTNECTSDIRTTREVIDLPASDSEELEDVLEDDDIIQGLVQTHAPSDQASTSQAQRTLLTPLPTVLKADRLGIGLKAKTEGPYKQSKKRVTHGAAALAAHIRSAQEMRKKKAAFGKGRRGFGKAHRREEDKRKATLAYLNE